MQKGEINKHYFAEAKDYAYQCNQMLEYNDFNVSDIVTHPVWGIGEIVSINYEKGEYQIEFLKNGFIKPINFEFKLLKKSNSLIDRYEFEKYRNKKPIANSDETKNTQVFQRETIKRKYLRMKFIQILDYRRKERKKHKNSDRV